MVPVSLWRVPHASALHWREWDGEFVVYHEPSGDTHRLNTLAARVLHLLIAEEMSQETLTARLVGNDGEQTPDLRDGEEPRAVLVDLLHRLAELGLIEAR